MGSTEPLGRGRRLDHPSVRMAKFVARLVSTPAAGQGGATRRVPGRVGGDEGSKEPTRRQSLDF